MTTMPVERPRKMLYGMVEAAQALGVQRTTMYDLASRGEVETVKIGRRRLVTAESLERYVSRLTEAGDECT